MKTGKWRETTSFKSQGWHHSGAAIFYKDAFYVSGGVTEKQQSYPLIQKFNIKDETWNYVKENNDSPLRLKTPRSKHSIIVLQDKQRVGTISSASFKLSSFIPDKDIYCWW